MIFYTQQNTTNDGGIKVNIVIKEENKNRIDEAIKKAEGKATARCISHKTVFRIIDSLNGRFGNVSKKNLKGTVIHFDNAQHFPNAYHYRPESTHFKARHNGTNWTLTDVYRDTCPNRMSFYVSIELSDMAKNAILKNYETL